MKKVFTVLMALTMVIGIAGFASAEMIDATNCAGDGGNLIVPGCGFQPTEQGPDRDCGPFDFESDRCTGKQDNRALFPVCDCVDEGYFDSLTSNQEYGICMTIWVDKHDGQGPVEGDNFVYWAGETLNDGMADLSDGIDVLIFEREGQACQVNSLGQYTGAPIPSPVTPNAFGSSFDDFDFRLANGNAGSPETCAVGDECGTCVDLWRVVELELKSDVEGFLTESGDSSNWVIDIPEMWADLPNAQAGWTVYVEVCLNQRGLAGEGVENICVDCNCCFLLEVGTLCCESAPSSCQDILTFPFFPSKDNFWLGMAITNKGSEEGTANITIYENNGETATISETIPANSTKIIADFAANTSGGAVQAYAKAVCDFPASGFTMFGQVGAGDESLGYLAERCGDCSGCDH